MKILHLSDAEYDLLVTTLEGAKEELEELEHTEEWFVSKTPERIDRVLMILAAAEAE